jgi:hypothetical protein
LNSGIHDMMASFRILGLDLDFPTISKALGVGPSFTRRKGEHGLAQTPHSTDVWCLDSPHSRSAPLDVHLTWLRDALLPSYKFLRSLKGECDLSIYCGVTIEGDRCQFRTSSSALRLFTELGIDMDLSLVFTGYSDSVSPDTGTASAKDQLDSEGARASFQIFGTVFDADKISRTIGGGSLQARPSGDASVPKDSSPSDVWFLLPDVPQSTDLDAQLRWLGARLSPQVGFLTSLKRPIDMLIQCNFITGSDTGGVVLSSLGLEVCTKLDIPLEFKVLLLWR